MLSSDEIKAGGKPNQRKGKPAREGRKVEQRNRKIAPPQDSKSDQSQAASEQGAPVAPIETTAPSPSSADTSPIVPAAAEESTPAVSYRAIADAWGSYSQTSLEQTRSYFEKLAGVRSLGAAFEVQAEFAKQACETFVAQSQRIGELQSELAKQRLKRLEGFMEKITQSAHQR